MYGFCSDIGLNMNLIWIFGKRYIHGFKCHKHRYLIDDHRADIFCFLHGHYLLGWHIPH